ncbi:MAG TPA: glycogen debranching N-terminal domain-containing protein [Micrococcaceae bacterium]|nr:glycogen debranching N-terminal domain-containing protein [Micrococcaceae bacterium]
MVIQDAPRESRQPFLHKLSPAVAAPYQLWLGPDGQLRPEGAQGAYLGDTRVLSQAILCIDGMEPEAVEAYSLPAHGGQCATARFLHRSSGPAGGASVYQLQRSLLVTPGGIRERIRIDSRSDAASTVELSLRFASDLAGMDAVRSGGMVGPAPVRLEGGVLTWGGGQGGGSDDGGQGGGSDGPPVVSTVLTPEDGTATSQAGQQAAVVVWTLELAAHGSAEVGWRLTGSDPLAPVAPPASWHSPDLASPSTYADPRLARLAAQAASDLAGLRLTTPDGPPDGFLAAGAPWYFTLFGRDSIWAARLLLHADPSLAAGTLRTLAAFQGSKVDPETAEEPGKIPHELRRASFSIPSENQGTDLHLPPLYYGTVDATPLWVCLLHDAWQAGMPDEQVEPLLDACERALDWMVHHGDSDGDGFLEYIDPTGKGLANQGWKDSADAVRWPDGRLASGPIALCEVQAYAYEAAMGGAALLTAFGRRGSEWRAWASQLARRFRDKFWCEDEAGLFPAIALDAHKVPVASVASNMGHLLGTGLLNAGESATVAQRLLQPEMFTGFGLRTLSRNNAGYWPLSYHCGSVWTHDTAIAIAGLAKDGHTTAAAHLALALLDAAEAFGYRLPELFGGYAREEAPRPVPYPMSCFPQAWAAASAAPILAALGADDGASACHPHADSVGTPGYRRFTGRSCG